MKRLIILFTAILACFSEGSSNPDKVLRLNRVNSTITVDGIVDTLWGAADSASDFIQHSPYYQKDPSVKTVAKVLTTDETLYCLMVCYDDKKNIQRTTGKLDDFSGDVVSIMLDTFGDKRSAYKFAVAASGVRMDARLLDDARDRDYSWDGIWFADSKIYDWGFVVEMEIPYKSIQYDKTLSEWGLDFDRWIPSRNEDLYWCGYEQREGQRISKFGRLVFSDFYPSVKGLNLEIYPVGIARGKYLGDGKYKCDPDIGADIFYNPSEQLTYQLTVNPDFAQIEADPFEFNISRYETYFNERRPFFTEGNEIFMPSGRQRNSGFYQPLQLFYSRRIGKKLPDGKDVPLIAGTRAFGRINDLEYGGFVALTGEETYTVDTSVYVEPRGFYSSVRLKKQILGNSSIGFLFVGKHSRDMDNGVLDIDGAFRGSDWQLAYQMAGSYMNSEIGFAASGGYTLTKDDYILFMRGRYIKDNFLIGDVGFVPWTGTAEFISLFGPRWYHKEGYISSILLYVGPILSYEKADSYTDRGGLIGFNMQFRDNWGYEINLSYTRSKDNRLIYNSTEINYSSWFNVDPKWNGNLWGGYSKTYNFLRDYVAFYARTGVQFGWRAADILELGTSASMFIEGNPENNIKDITYNARPYLSLTPVNDMNIRIYVDNVFEKSADRLKSVIGGLLFSYNFLPKSWIYFALNEIYERRENYDDYGNLTGKSMCLADRAAVLKIKYLYYF